MAGGENMKFVQVTCNNKLNPIGVGEDPVFGWKYKGVIRQEAYRIIVRCAGDEVWDSGVVHSGKTCGVEYAGAPLAARTEYAYRVYGLCGGQWIRSEEQTFETALLGGFTARWLSYPSNFAGYSLFARNIKALPSPPVKARMYIAGIGYYEAYVNGKKVSQSVLNPGVTDYSKRILYDVWDVTDLYRGGENLTAVLLGNGWYGMQKFICEIYFEFADGSFDKVETNAQMDWFLTGSPIVRQSIYGGECYDARREEKIDGWDGSFRHINYFESGWMFSVYADEPAGKLVPQENERIEVVRKVPCVGAERLGEGVTVYDFGEIFAGRCRIRVRGARGARILLKHAEGLREDGQVDRLNLRSAQAEDEYICKGGKTEEWAPRFTYHGFRYVQAEAEGAEILSVEGEALSNAVAPIGCFECSDKILNRLHENTVRTEQSNMHSIPTDCPQRDERFGWLNDLTSRLDQALMNFDVSLFYEKFMCDISDTQDERGAIGDTAPYKTGSRPADPVVVSYLLIPLRLYQRYGNARIVKREYKNCKKWVDFLLGLAEGNLLKYGIYGDWAPPAAYSIPDTPCNRVSEPPLVSGAYLYWYCRILSRLAEIAGLPEDKARYAAKAEEIRRDYNAAYFDGVQGRYKNASQTGNAIPLNLGLCPEEHRAHVAAFISDDVALHGDHLTTGNQAYKHMLESLADFGYAEQMVRMIVNPTYPGWGYMIRSGATSIWERWEAEMASAMNSFCHPMHGSIDAWFYGWLGGIRFDDGAVGADKLVIRPHFGGLQFVNCSLETARGKVSVRWKRQGGRVLFSVVVPPCTQARFVSPCDLASVNGAPAGGRELQLSAGSYEIVGAKAAVPCGELELPQRYSPAQHLIPLWSAREIYDETLLFVGENGRARLLCEPCSPPVVRSYDLQTTYEEGRDYVLEGREIVRLAQSRIPFFPEDEYFRTTPDEVGIGVLPEGAELAFSQPRFLKYGEKDTFTCRQAAVSYRTAEPLRCAVPPSRRTVFEPFFIRAAAGGASVLFYGDSIAVGCNASGTEWGGCKMPFTPSWPQIVHTALEEACGCRIGCRNASVGGRKAADGLAHAPEAFAEGADLLVLAFGMNDVQTPPETYAAQMRGMIEVYREAHPDGCVLLVSSMPPNLQSDWVGNLPCFEALLGDIARREKNTAVAPVYSLFADCIRTGKRNRDWLANNINHPNDFGIRLYAQCVIRTLIGGECGQGG